MFIAAYCFQGFRSILSTKLGNKLFEPLFAQRFSVLNQFDKLATAVHLDFGLLAFISILGPTVDRVGHSMTLKASFFSQVINRPDTNVRLVILVPDDSRQLGKGVPESG